ncbi:MAG: serpin family protein [Phocaeicola sp.]|uniref:serpin family protein n=1 Tax=Phocaeicola sp. TaxID=2773926 RepID=UPI003FA0A433
MKKFIGLVICTTLFICSGCSKNESIPLPGKRQEITLTTRSKTINENIQNFSFKFFQQINATEIDKPNLMVSPFSLSMALAMTANGAQNATLDEMKKVLGFEDSSSEEFNEYYQTMMKELPNIDSSIKMSIANSIWVANNLILKTDFVKTNKTVFDAEVKNADFNSSNTLKAINDWIADKTNDCIKDFLQELDPGTRMMLINALYFKGSWTSKFNKADTKKKKFTNLDGSVEKVDMMHQENPFAYATNNTFEMLCLPYGNQAYRMMVLLPNKNTTMNDAIKKLDYQMYQSLYEKLDNINIDVELPKFKQEYRKTLVDDMKTMGIHHAFSANADFFGISKEPLNISDIIQGTYINVDEEGTEAASVTVINLYTSAVPEAHSIQFHVNRPFLYLIQEQSTGAILFMGKVTEL